MLFLRAMNGHWEMRYRWLGVLPLIFFVVQTIHYWRYGGMGNLLWICNLGNIVLGVGLLIGHRELIRVAGIWTIPGLAIWIVYVLLPSGFYVSTALAHVGGIVVGLFAVRRVGMDRHAWLYAFVWGMVTQLAARLLSPPELNVNVAHRVQTGWESTFNSYWKFWIVFATASAVVLWLIGKGLMLILPAKPVSEQRAMATRSEVQT